MKISPEFPWVLKLLMGHSSERLKGHSGDLIPISDLYVRATGLEPGQYDGVDFSITLACTKCGQPVPDVSAYVDGLNHRDASWDWEDNEELPLPTLEEVISQTADTAVHLFKYDGVTVTSADEVEIRAEFDIIINKLKDTKPEHFKKYWVF